MRARSDDSRSFTVCPAAILFASLIEGFAAMIACTVVPLAAAILLNVSPDLTTTEPAVAGVAEAAAGCVAPD